MEKISAAWEYHWL